MSIPDVVLVALVMAVPQVITAIAAWRNGRRIETKLADSDIAREQAVADLALKVQVTADVLAQKVEATATDVAAVAQQAASEVAAKVEVVTAKTEDIHGLVNSSATAMKADLAIANERIETLEALVIKLTAKAEIP